MIKKSILIALSFVTGAVGSAKEHRLNTAVKAYEQHLNAGMVKYTQAQAERLVHDGQQKPVVAEVEEGFYEVAGCMFSYDSDGLE